MVYKVTCEQVGALRIESGWLSAREALRLAYGARHGPPPPWAGPWVRLAVVAHPMRSVRAWEYLHPDGWRRVG